MLFSSLPRLPCKHCAQSLLLQGTLKPWSASGTPKPNRDSGASEGLCQSADPQGIYFMDTHTQEKDQTRASSAG